MIFNKRMLGCLFLIPLTMVLMMILPERVLSLGTSLTLGFSVCIFGLGLILGQWTIIKNKLPEE